ncbi:MAG TPA: GntR family transcriptional regulator [Chitinispirillaceae bacterium]|nr:GntR family transcriptional regulator [Chitinispirillaceae bacterium]
MPHKKKPVLQETIEKIRALLKITPDNNLSSVRKLAQQFKVSPVTILRAIRALEHEGLLASRWGKGVFAAENQPLAENPEGQKMGKYLMTLHQFKMDIISGKFQTHLPLPPINQLADLYNASYPTIRKVLSSLLEENLLKRTGARYYFFTNRLKQRSRIALVAFGMSRGLIKIETERERNFYLLLSSIATNNNVDLEIICYNDYLDIPCFYTPKDLSMEVYLKSSGISGIILSSYHMNNSAECLATLMTYNIPVSAWIEDSRILSTVDRFGSHYRKLTFFDSSYSTIPGRDVGRYLLENGHRSIAFISPFHGSPWSQNRLKGLKKAVLLHPDAILYPFTVSEYINDYFYMLPFLENADFNRHFKSDVFTQQIDEFLSPRLSAIKYEHDTLLRDNAIFSSIKNAVDHITANQCITALVCVNDLVASLITDYWNYNHISHDKRPVLIGFDNSFKSLQQQFSSYEFNTQGEIQNMINHVLYPESTLFTRNKPVIRLSGKVIERASHQFQTKRLLT